MTPMHRADVQLEGRATSRAGLEGIEAQLDVVLGQLRRKVRGVRGSVVADSNGLTIASDIRSGVSPATLAAMSTLIAQFFFQAEDGIRDYKVTGVQTCALPI